MAPRHDRRRDRRRRASRSSQDLEGERDPIGYELHATVIAVADEIAGAAQLVFGKLDRIPVAVVRGLDVARRAAARRSSSIPPERDLFR